MQKFVTDLLFGFAFGIGFVVAQKLFSFLIGVLGG